MCFDISKSKVIKMSEGNKVVEDLDRLTLKQLRKERKFAKKKFKREEQERENDKRKLELKLGPKDQHVTIISRDEANHIKKPEEFYSCNNNFNFNSTNYDNFPVLDNISQLKQRHLKQNSTLSVTDTAIKHTLSTKPGKTNTLKINLTEILIKPKPAVTNKSASTETVKKYGGNILDSSLPERQKGKHREVPKPKPLTKLKSQIIADIEKCGNTDSTFSFCDNLITDELNNAVKEFLSNIVRFQENLYKRDPIKGIAKRRYITGFREVKKFLFVKKIKFLILSPNIKNVVNNGALDAVIHELIALATKNNIPYVFALTRRKLGKITLKNIPISCVGIFYYDGAEQLFNNILQLSKELRKPSENYDPQIQDVAEIQNEVINILSSDEVNIGNTIYK